MKALIDADLILYRVGFASQNVPEGIAKSRLDYTIDKILADLETNDYHVYLSGQKPTFRHEIHPDYKNHRTQEKPIHLSELRTHLICNYKNTIADGEEADDLLGKESTKNNKLYWDYIEDLVVPIEEPCI